jgi:hypothetical protein
VGAFLDLPAKGQLILKGRFGVLKSTKKPTIILRISALASQMGRIKKICPFIHGGLNRELHALLYQIINNH